MHSSRKDISTLIRYKLFVKPNLTSTSLLLDASLLCPLKALVWPDETFIQPIPYNFQFYNLDRVTLNVVSSRIFLPSLIIRESLQKLLVCIDIKSLLYPAFPVKRFLSSQMSGWNLVGLLKIFNLNFHTFPCLNERKTTKTNVNTEHSFLRKWHLKTYPNLSNRLQNESLESIPTTQGCICPELSLFLLWLSTALQTSCTQDCRKRVPNIVSDEDWSVLDEGAPCTCHWTKLVPYLPCWLWALPVWDWRKPTPLQSLLAGNGSRHLAWGL